MEKLELKHLAPYLPYGLKYWSKEHKAESILDCYKPESFDNIMKTISMEAILRHPDIYKPILRPLSDLTKEIEVNGIKFTPQRTWGISQGQLKTTLFYKDCGEMYFRHIKLLFEFHFDVFGLIEKGLAIDINTIKQ